MSESVNNKVKPDTDHHLGSTMYWKYKANNVILLRSRVMSLHLDLELICFSFFPSEITQCSWWGTHSISPSIYLVRSFRTTRSWCLLMWSGCSLLFLSRTLSWFWLQSWRVTMRPGPFDPKMLTSSQIAYWLEISFQDLSSLSTTDPITNNKMMQQCRSLCMKQFLTSTWGVW